jgi:hypothetical protein
MFLIDTPFKGCQGRLNRSSIVHAFLIFFAYQRCFAYDFNFSKLFVNFYGSCGVNDPHAFLKNRISSGIQIYIQKGFSLLFRGPGRCFDEKNRGSKIS